MTESTRVLLVRHGETDWNRDGRLQGWAPVGLNGKGREQARLLGLHLADRFDIDHLLASDLDRAKETTRIILEGGVDARPTFERSWRERGLGVLQGFDREFAFTRFPGLSPDLDQRAVREQPPGGESLREVYDRVTAGWETLRGDAAGQTSLVVTHGGPLAILLGHLDGRDLPASIGGYSFENCEGALVTVEPDETVSWERVQPL